jgi:hypothetical protein
VIIFELAWYNLLCRNFDSSEFDSTGVKLYILIHNEVRDFDKNSTQPEIRVNRVRDNESQRIKIGSQVKHPVIDFDIITLGYFTYLF